jgi:hypothetical protein
MTVFSSQDIYSETPRLHACMYFSIQIYLHGNAKKYDADIQVTREGYERHCVETRRVVAARVKQDIAQEVARNLAQNQGDHVSQNLPTANIGGTESDGDRMDID